MTEAYKRAIEQGYTHCASYCLKTDNPQNPWRQTFFKNLKEAKYWEKWVLSVGGRVLVSSMFAARKF
jgi:hypothetical protein